MESYYSWLILGVILLVIEITTGTFYLLGFGFAALLTALLNYIFKLDLTHSLIIFTIFSPILIKIFIITIKDKNKDKKQENYGQSNDIHLNKVGIIIKEKQTTEDYAEISFETSVMGSRNWFVLSKEELKIGDKAKIISVDGNILVVEKV